MYDWKCVSGGAVERRCFLVKNDLFFLLHEILLFLRSAFSQFLLLREAKQRKKEMNAHCNGFRTCRVANLPSKTMTTTNFKWSQRRKRRKNPEFCYFFQTAHRYFMFVTFGLQRYQAKQDERAARKQKKLWRKHLYI